ncbi:MAG: C10 family peptidase [bacterium]|nr:C10 family peptidase [bacterium]
MKKIFTFFALFCFSAFAFAKPVSLETAKMVGQNFLSSRTNSAAFKTAVSLELAYTASSAANSSVAAIRAANYFFVFNVSNGNGYVIVSADDNAAPVLAYSDEGDFNPQNMGPNTRKWLDNYKAEIRYIIQNNIEQTKELKEDWSLLMASATPNTSLSKKATVSPLVQTKWNQSPNYNAQCPYDNGASERTVTGCVATAMAQIMKYWNYPATGSGSHSYNHSKYGTLSANFSSTSYNWAAMPNAISGSNSAIATLMYHCGVSVDMQYDIASNGGSGAYVISSGSPVTHCSEYALKNYFGYKSTLIGIKRINYTQSAWIALLKAELNASRPILHDGFGSGGGHCFVADGFDNNDFFHFNWGWGGQEDGYFNVNALNPGSLGTGGGSGGFNTGQEVVIGIQPPSSPQVYDLRLYSAITVNPTPIPYGAGFSVTVNFANYGTTSANNFSGDFAAAVYNTSNQFVAYIETKTGYNLTFNSYYSNPLVFTTSGIAALTPGNYTIGMYYKPTGASQWVAMGNGSYQNFKAIEVKGNDTNPLKLYAAITPSPAVITRNQSFTVSFDVANFGSSTFEGEISVDIHKSNGSWIRELSTKSGLSLPTNTHFTNGLTYTITGGVNDSAGTYQFFVWDKPTNGDWEFLGTGTFSNPISVQLIDPSLNPDMFEPNNTVATAFNMPLAFSGSVATKSTTGSNIHIGNDYDYYKFTLPAGYKYTITSRIHDSYSSGNSQSYTIDGLVSYSTDGSTWSEPFDDIVADNIVVNGGGTVYFLVSPYFTGSTGSYLLDVAVTRSAISNSDKDITGFIVPGMIGSANINTSNATVNITVSTFTNVMALVPVISVSNFASINPSSGVARDFTNPLKYMVTAQDASTKEYTVTVTKATGLENLSLADAITVYPNPAKNSLNINLTQFKGEIQRISLFDINGALQASSFDDAKGVLNFDLVNNGMYILQVETNMGILIKKVFIQP